MLRDSLGGNSKTCIVANVSPANKNSEETLGTLQFAQRAKKIKNEAVVNEDTSGDMALLTAEISRLRGENAALVASHGGGQHPTLTHYTILQLSVVRIKSLTVARLVNRQHDD